MKKTAIFGALGLGVVTLCLGCGEAPWGQARLSYADEALDGGGSGAFGWPARGDTSDRPGEDEVAPGQVGDSGWDGAVDVAPEPVADSALVDASGSVDASWSDDVGDTAVADSAPEDAPVDAPDTTIEDVLVEDGDVVVEDAPGDTAPDVAEEDALSSPRVYLLHSSQGSLKAIDVESGESRVVCTFAEAARYPSLAFTDDGALYGPFGASVLRRVDPCTCEQTEIGAIGEYRGMNGLATNLGEAVVYGLSTNSDVLLRIDPETAEAEVVGEGLGSDFESSGLSRSEVPGELYSINSRDNALYRVSSETGRATRVVSLGRSFSQVGVEWHPSNGALYGCTRESSGGAVYRIDVATGGTTRVARLNSSCNNLAAPTAPIACVDAVWAEAP